MAEVGEKSQGIQYTCRYWLEVSAIGFFCTILWLFCGMVIGSDSVFHEWELLIVGMVIYWLPVVMVGSWVLAAVTPQIATWRHHLRPFETAKWVVVAWTIVAMVSPLAIFALMGG